MMGNENSQLSGLVIEEKPIEITDFWCHHQAYIKDSCRYFSLKGDGSVSVFKGEAAAGPLWAISSPLEKFSNNLLKYRHPYIVRYISSWQQRSTIHLATEFVQPLSQILSSMTPHQICIGLDNILRALVFLHDQANMSHNNVGVSAVYVTGDGQWKLGGLQYLCPFKELTSTYLKHARIHRYDKAVDPNEDAHEMTANVDQYAFAVFVEDVVKDCKDDDIPNLKEFKKYCRDRLQHHNPAARPKLSEVLSHSFFNHQFISIYKSLNSVALMTEEERRPFFTHILSDLRCYDEETVAKQLGGLLLSRPTMLDQTAQKEVIPFLLKPRNERASNGENVGLFSLPVFKEHIKPRLMQLFDVRDSQIRMLLLRHFSKFVLVFSHEELSRHILPELLLGIKDIDDNLVSASLICLSELVPILGADTVIGGTRSRFFTDGRPNCSQLKPYVSSTNNVPESNIYPTAKSLHDLPCSEDVFESSNELNVFEKSLTLNERPSPVGGESLDDDDEIIATEINIKAASEEDWSDWENNRQLSVTALNVAEAVLQDEINHNDSTEAKATEVVSSVAKTTKHIPDSRTILLQKAAIEAKKNIVDISELDIKNQKYDYSRKSADEFDFFADMMPVIEKPAVVNITQDAQNVSSKFNFVPDENVEDNEAWSEDWND